MARRAWKTGGWVAVVFAWTLFAAAAAAQDVRVTKGAAQKSPLDWTGLQSDGSAASRTLLTVLQNDLQRSGWFAAAGAGRGELRLAGTCSAAGANMDVACALYRVATADTLLSRRYRGPAGEARRLAHTVADDVVEAATGRKGFASSRLALVGNRTGKKELYLCDADGGNLVSLTRDGGISLYPRWSPDNTRLLYTGYLKGFPDVYEIELRSGRRRRVSSFPGLNAGASFSPDGRSMALILSKDGNPELYITPVSGRGPTRVTRTPGAAESSPSWSPDGREIVFVSDRSGSPQLYIVSRNGGKARRLTSRGSENVAPDWGPHGLIAYASRLGGRYVLCVVDPKTLEAKQLALDYADYEDPNWARDGRHIACVRTVNYHSQVYLVDTLGDEPVSLLSERGDWFSPAWSR